MIIAVILEARALCEHYCKYLYGRTVLPEIVLECMPVGGEDTG